MKQKLIFKKIIVLLTLLSAFHFPVVSQGQKNKYPSIGDPCPDFILNNLVYYSKNSASYNDFKGKPIIINFFSRGCGSAFESLPHLKEMQKEFEGRVQFILIGKSDLELKKEYEKYKDHYKLNFPVDYDDSVLWKKFGVYYVAHTIWIDSTGIIRQITSPYALNNQRIENLISGKPQTMTMSKTLSNHEDYFNGVSFFDTEKPYLINGNGGNDTSFSYRSIFSNWNYKTEFNVGNYINAQNGRKLIETGASLEALYKLAYGDTVEFQIPYAPFGVYANAMNAYSEWSSELLLKTKRKDLFNADYYTGNNVFTYSLEVPYNLGNAKSLQSILQRELKNYFGFDVTVETRLQPCWKLIADPDKVSALKTKGGKSAWEGGFSNFTVKNLPISAVINNIYAFNQDECTFLDETGIQGNIDLEMNCILTDLDDVKKELRKNGLDLVKGEKKLKVIVVQDPN